MDTHVAVMGAHSTVCCCYLEAAMGETKGFIQHAILGWRTSCHGNPTSVIPASGHTLQNRYGLRCHSMEPEEAGGSLYLDPGDRLSSFDMAVSGYSPLRPANKGRHI